MNRYQSPVIVALIGVMIVFSGCREFRYAATEAQKENAWLHRQVCQTAAETAVEEQVSPALCGLTRLASEQSTAFVLDYGQPNLTSSPPFKGECPEGTRGYWDIASSGDEIETILSHAKADSLRKPDVFEVADGVLELGIAVAGLFGGAYGIRLAGCLKTAREKSKALGEIVAGNELFKQLWPEQADRFKEAQTKQTPVTRQIVTKLKSI